MVPILCPLFITTLLNGCSVRQMAVNAVANSLAGGGSSVYLSDDDPVLVGQALPFSLKMMESILEETPEHQELLIATASGFTMYAHAYVLQPARKLESTDLRGARAERARAKRLFLRGRRYAGRALEQRHAGILEELSLTPDAAAGRLERDDIPAMYWYAAALGSAISSDKNDMDLVADLPVVSALLERARDLDEAWNDGAIHELLMVVVVSESTGPGGGTEEAEGHFNRAMELNGGRSIGPLVSLAETVCVQQQDRERFTALLTEALEFDVDEYPEMRLANLISQEHARWLLSQTDDLFYEDADDADRGVQIHGGMLRWPVHM